MYFLELNYTAFLSAAFIHLGLPYHVKIMWCCKHI